MGAELGTLASCMPESSERNVVRTGENNRNSSIHTSCGRPTLFIFDWDDTLLCSSAVRKHVWAVEELEELEKTAETILRTAMSLGETMVVTNGNRTWVQDSARRYLPGLLPLLSQLRVVSARALCEDQFPGDPFMWKQAGFEYLLTQQRQFTDGVNLIALGDQYPEIDAAKHVTRVIGGCSIVKTVKLHEAPTVSQLLGQLRSLEPVLSDLALEKESQDYHVVPRGLPPPFDHLTSSASGWQCVTEDELAGGGCIDPLSSVKGLLSLVA